jgi:PmbA protein
MTKTETLEAAAEFAIKEAKRLGATEADVSVQSKESMETAVRMGKVEQLEGIAEGRSVDFTAYVGKNSASTTTTDLRRASITKMVRQTIAMAKVSQPDEFAGLPELRFMASAARHAATTTAPRRLTEKERVEMALAAEKAAMDYDPRIVNSEGCGFSDTAGVYVYANSNDFVGSHRFSSYSLSASVVAAQGDDDMQTSWWYDSKVRPELLASPKQIGEKAAMRAVRMLGARKVASAEVPVVIDPMVAARILRQIVGAANAQTIARGASFLVGKLGEKIASDKLTILDDPFMVDGFGTSPFGDQGLKLQARTIVADGVLSSYLIDAYGGRQIKMDPNGGSPTNLFIAKGKHSHDEIIKSVTNGLYLTQTSGPGFNTVTGDVSVGASGVWIENGVLTYPVQEVTVAGTFKEMLEALEMVGDNLEFMGSTAAPTLLIGKMMVAGKNDDESDETTS